MSALYPISMLGTASAHSIIDCHFCMGLANMIPKTIKYIDFMSTYHRNYERLAKISKYLLLGSITTTSFFFNLTGCNTFNQLQLRHEIINSYFQSIQIVRLSITIRAKPFYSLQYSNLSNNMFKLIHMTMLPCFI